MGIRVEQGGQNKLFLLAQHPRIRKQRPLPHPVKPQAAKYPANHSFQTPSPNARNAVQFPQPGKIEGEAKKNGPPRAVLFLCPKSNYPKGNTRAPRLERLQQSFNCFPRSPLHPHLRARPPRRRNCLTGWNQHSTAPHSIIYQSPNPQPQQSSGRLRNPPEFNQLAKA